MLDTLGLPVALQLLGREFGEDGQTEVTVEVEGEPATCPRGQTALFRVARKALANVPTMRRRAPVRIELGFAPDGVGLHSPMTAAVSMPKPCSSIRGAASALRKHACGAPGLQSAASIPSARRTGRRHRGCMPHVPAKSDRALQGPSDAALCLALGYCARVRAGGWRGADCLAASNLGFALEESDLLRRVPGLCQPHGA
jgi:hypothetical protein